MRPTPSRRESDAVDRSLGRCQASNVSWLDTRGCRRDVLARGCIIEIPATRHAAYAQRARAVSYHAGLAQQQQLVYRTTPCTHPSLDWSLDQSSFCLVPRRAARMPRACRAIYSHAAHNLRAGWAALAVLNALDQFHTSSASFTACASSRCGSAAGTRCDQPRGITRALSTM